MIKSKYFMLLLLLAVVFGLLPGDAPRLTDDRELFMGVTGVTKIKPNLLIMFDNSGSMESVIYHPTYSTKTNYNPNTALTLEQQFTNLESIFLDFNSDGDTGNRFSNTAAHTLTSVATFKVCKGNPTYTFDYTKRFTFNSTKSSSPTRVWRINRTGVLPAGSVPAIGDILNYSCTSPSGAPPPVCSNATVTKVVSTTYSGVNIWEVTVTATANPSNGSYVYINYHKDTTWDTATVLKKTSEDSSAYHETIVLKLYGADLHLTPTLSTQYSTQDDGVMYDDNYLFWLFYHASTAQLNEVTAWSTGVNQGKFPDSSGVLQWAGLHRIGVARQTLIDLADDVHEQANLGLAYFGVGQSVGGGDGVIKYSIDEDDFDLDDFKSAITSVKTNAGGTMLSETMADIWSYFKGTRRSNYTINNGTQTLDSNMPIDPYCRNSYVILMTDGQSTSDNFNDAFYNGSIFRNDVKTWGDQDNNDPPGSGTSRIQPTALGTYCTLSTCWIKDSNGTDFLDDVALLMNKRDLFPDAIYNGSAANRPNMPGMQVVTTYVIGLTVDNDMLRETADKDHGNGQYYTAKGSTELKNALVAIITNINLRDFAFAAFTAPKRVTKNIGEGSSYVGYFRPSTSLNVDTPIWEGYLQSFLMTDKWCPQLLWTSTVPNTTLFCTGAGKTYESEFACEHDATINPDGKPCGRTLDMADTYTWDAREVLKNRTTDRSLFTHNSLAASPKAMIAFTSANNATLLPLFGLPATADGTTKTATIISTINRKLLGDIFHSDIAYVGPPMAAKKFLKNLNPAECPATGKDSNANCFEKLLATYGATEVENSGRKKVVYFGSNDGILHQIDAGTGAELWGFIPDEVLPSLNTIVTDREYTFTVDGRLSADDIYYRGASAANNTWKTILPFGLRDGGNSFYALDITAVGNTPVLLWKFNDVMYSGKSWGKPVIGKIKYNNGTDIIDLSVVVFAGGFAFNNENPNDLQGKAVFVIDASNGSLLWMIGYKPTGVAHPGAADDAETLEIDTLLDSSVTTGVRYLTAKSEFNYSIPSALTVIDRDGNGYLDTLYYGNVAGHLFKTSIASSDPADWKTYMLFNQQVTNSVSARITNVNGSVVTVANVAGFVENQSVIGSNSHAMGIINYVNGTDLTIAATPAAGGPVFNTSDNLLVRDFDPIFLSPAVAYDTCFNLWLGFGTGDRTRSRTNPTTSKFASLRDGTVTVDDSQVQKTNVVTGDLVQLTWTGSTITTADDANNVKVDGKWGWYFTFPDSANYEKLFDPEPLILPDQYLRPHFYFNSYQRPSSEVSSAVDCNAPEDATMKFYDITVDYCSSGTITGAEESGRLAGGGMFIDYLIIQGTGELGSVPPVQAILDFKLKYTGGLLFWKEKKR